MARGTRPAILILFMTPFLVGWHGRTAPLVMPPSGVSVVCVLINAYGAGTIHAIRPVGANEDDVPRMARLIDDTAGNQVLAQSDPNDPDNYPHCGGQTFENRLKPEQACVITYVPPENTPTPTPAPSSATPTPAPAAIPHTVHCEFNISTTPRRGRGALLIFDSNGRK